MSVSPDEAGAHDAAHMAISAEPYPGRCVLCWADEITAAPDFGGEVVLQFA